MPWRPEIWASPEPTIARIDAQRTRNQLIETGHAARADDIARLSALGVSASRYPVLWESVAPAHPTVRNYGWADTRLRALREAGVEPIVTLLHHGSGPAYTSLLDPAFPALFADYAAATARVFPWVRRWTPINEPLTTARFATLYGVWFPNGVFDDRAFATAIVNEALAIAEATRRIRAIIPNAEFLLTEDLQSFTAGDASVADYVAHKRERMYLSCELLQGRIVDGHPMHAYLRERGGISRGTLDALARDPQPPDVMGWNYYPFSERYLAGAPDGHTNRALFEVDPAALNLPALLRSAYARLRLPFALSEVHVLGDERERARWMLARYADAQAAVDDGVEITAFGAWAAFGMVDWVSLLREEQGASEDGVYTFAGSEGTPQPTLVAEVVRSLARGVVPEMPKRLGWWEQSAVAHV